MWNGFNYLLKMPSDLDFLATDGAFIEWIGFPIERNPFIIPLSMENRPVSGGNDTDGKPMGKFYINHSCDFGFIKKIMPFTKANTCNYKNRPIFSQKIYLSKMVSASVPQRGAS